VFPGDEREMLMSADDQGTGRFRVVVNREEQYSIWPEGRELPRGWRDEGTSGTKQECLDHIEAVWADTQKPIP
jgi:MbtH protein